MDFVVAILTVSIFLLSSLIVTGTIWVINKTHKVSKNQNNNCK